MFRKILSLSCIFFTSMITCGAMQNSEHESVQDVRARMPNAIELTQHFVEMGIEELEQKCSIIKELADKELSAQDIAVIIDIHLCRYLVKNFDAREYDQLFVLVSSILLKNDYPAIEKEVDQLKSRLLQFNLNYPGISSHVEQKAKL